MNCDLVSFDATTNSYCYMIYASCCKILGPTLQICQRICGPRWLGWEALGRSQAISCQVFQTAWNDRTKLWAFLQLGWFQATCGRIDLCILVFAYSWFIDLRSTCTGYNMSCNCNAHLLWSRFRMQRCTHSMTSAFRRPTTSILRNDISWVAVPACLGSSAISWPRVETWNRCPWMPPWDHNYYSDY